MKKYYMLLLPLLVLVGCKSNEDKAAELIKTELSKTLYDFDSYSPIETIVTEVNRSVYTDTAYWKQAQQVAYVFNSAMNALKEAKDASEYMDIWGPPTYYSSSHSDRKYYEYKEKFDEKKLEAFTNLELLKMLGLRLRDSLNAIDESEIVGWEVTHKFRCKTRGGNSTIGDYRYVMDKKFTTILIREDMDDDDSKMVRGIIKEIMDGELDDFNVSL